MGNDDDVRRLPGQARQALPGGMEPPIKMVPEGTVRVRLFGWALAFTIVGVAVCVTMTVLIVVAVVFADRLPCS